MPDVGRVHLELEEEDVLLAGRDAAELEGKAAVAACLADRGRLDGVDRDPLGPAGVENERSLPDLADGVDPEARLVEEPASHALRRMDLEPGGVGPGDGRRRPLPEEVEKAEPDDDHERCKRDPPGRHVSLSLAVPSDLEHELVRDVGHPQCFRPAGLQPSYMRLRSIPKTPRMTSR